MASCRQQRFTKVSVWLLLLLGAAASSVLPFATVLADDTRIIPRPSLDNFEGAVVHAPVAEDKCMVCHSPHGGEPDKLLREKPPALCTGCHDEPYMDEDGRTRPSIKSLFEAAELPLGRGGVRLHKPVADGNCTHCHDPHASDNYRLLNLPIQRAAYVRYAPERYELCLGCHDVRAFDEPRALEKTNFRNGNLNLHHRHVNRDKGISCSLCHEPHGTTFDDLIRREAPFGKEAIRIHEYSKTPTGGSCAPSCHILVEYDRVRPVDNNMEVSPREGEDATPAELRVIVRSPTAGMPPRP